MNADAEVIVLAGVHFMAKTAKLLNPAKTVLIPDQEAGCSLAASIRPEDVRLLRERYPGVPVVTYVNTSAAVKAESDICCTSSNARKVIQSLGVCRVIMLPDEYLAQNVAAAAPRRHCLGASRMPARGRRRGGFHRFDCGYDRLCRRVPPAARSHGDRVLNERQRFRSASRYRVHPALHSLSAHEADHAAEDPSGSRDHEPRGDDRPWGRACGPQGGRTDAGHLANVDLPGTGSSLILPACRLSSRQPRRAHGCAPRWQRDRA
jgi:Quinolinate synthetase A protein